MSVTKEVYDLYQFYTSLCSDLQGHLLSFIPYWYKEVFTVVSSNTFVEKFIHHYEPHNVVLTATDEYTIDDPAFKFFNEKIMLYDSFLSILPVVNGVAHGKAKFISYATLGSKFEWDVEYDKGKEIKEEVEYIV